MQILWLACRHHILELVVGAALTELFVLFNVIKNSWDTLNLADIKLPDLPSSYQHEVEDLLLFINIRLEPESDANLPRRDYKEFLELAKIILGSSIDRNKSYSYQIQCPWADHHARWMSKSIYLLKMELLGHQLKDLHWKTNKKVTKMSLFVFFAYLEA